MTKIVADGGDGFDYIDIQTGVTVPVELSGGPGRDFLYYRGSGAARLDGGEGDDILLDVPVSPIDLMLGTKLTVPTLDGKVALKVPPGTQSHKIFRLRGKGVPHLNRSGSGDELVRVISWTPLDLSTDQIKQLRGLRDGLASQVPPPGRDIYD